jgi:hypothetical protein
LLLATTCLPIYLGASMCVSVQSEQCFRPPTAAATSTYAHTLPAALQARVLTLYPAEGAANALMHWHTPGCQQQRSHPLRHGWTRCSLLPVAQSGALTAALVPSVPATCNTSTCQGRGHAGPIPDLHITSMWRRHTHCIWHVLSTCHNMRHGTLYLQHAALPSVYTHSLYT